MVTLMNGEKRSLVIVEDNPADATHYIRLLEEMEHDFEYIHCFSTLKDAALHVASSPPTCMLLDFQLPDGNAFSLIEAGEYSDISSICPLIVVTGHEDADKAVKLLKLGAQDYLTKENLDAQRLTRAIEQSIKAWRFQKDLNRLAMYDSLTGLANRALFLEKLSSLYDEWKRYKRNFALLYVDMDHFKRVNDNFGHEAGDILLKAFAQTLKDQLRSTDLAARIGGDEFAVLLRDISDEKAHHVAYKLTCALQFDLPWEKGKLEASASIGMTTIMDRAESYETLMREADFALYRAKKNGRAQYAFFNKILAKESALIARLGAALPRALLNRELKLAFQPIFDRASQDIQSVEASVRWEFDEQWISPTLIMELVQERRLVEPFHMWLFDTGIQQIAAWRKEKPDLAVAFKVPAIFCQDAKMMGQILPLLRKHGVPASGLIIELLEDSSVKHIDATCKQLTLLSQAGVHLAFDNFGGDESSLRHLSRLDFFSVKVDQQLFTEAQISSRHERLITGIVAMAHSMGLLVVVEGVESQKMLNMAQKFGCDLVQGGLLGMPVLGGAAFLAFFEQSKVAGAQLH